MVSLVVTVWVCSFIAAVRCRWCWAWSLQNVFSHVTVSCQRQKELWGQLGHWGGWTSLSLHFLPINAAQPKPSMVSCVACYSMHLSNWFLCYSWVNSILCNSSLPQFTSLFGLTEATSKIFSISSSISLTIRKGLRNFHSRISMKLGLAEPQSWETG